MENKKIDAVKMMREIREKLSRKYARDPEAEKRELEAIRKKYGLKEKVVASKTPPSKV